MIMIMKHDRHAWRI